MTMPGRVRSSILDIGLILATLTMDFLSFESPGSNGSEPGTFTLLGIGFIALKAVRRRARPEKAIMGS